MSEDRETIWVETVIDWHDGETGENFVGGTWDAGYLMQGTPYRRADLPPTLEQALAVPEVKALVEAALRAIGDDANWFDCQEGDTGPLYAAWRGPYQPEVIAQDALRALEGGEG